MDDNFQWRTKNKKFIGRNEMVSELLRWKLSKVASSDSDKFM